MVRKSILLLTVFILSTGISFAVDLPNETEVRHVSFSMITGSVVTASTGKAISNAKVRLSGTEESDVTDEYGTFLFEEVSNGNYTLSVTARGYQKMEKRINVTDNGVNIELQMKPSN